ncbi:MAG: ATP-dependent zinc metalloprotease FtsH [Chloroflexi bacterium]|nr:ATP-dependent zinc metalloprotease FtsH [Chloroflexota bacterium]
MENRPTPSSTNLAAVFWLLAAVGVFALLVVLASGGAARGEPQAPVSQVAAEVNAGRVTRIVARGDGLEIELKGGQPLSSRKEAGVSVPQTLRDYGVDQQALDAVIVQVETPADWSWLWNLVWLLPLLFFASLLFSLRRGGEAGMGDASQVFGFARSRARKITGARPEVRFDDVAGIEEAKEELQEVVEFLKSPWKFSALGARIPKGVLLVGPPGTGKTLLARAVAGEAGVPFFSQAASEFVELFVGVGASRVRDLFRQARDSAPCIVFIDEIDAVGRRRGAGLSHSHEEREQTLNQILAELDGFDPRANIVVMAATNRPDVLDPALLRPGRFDRRVILESPDLDSRLAILHVHARGKPLESEVDLARLARLTPGFSGADLENLLNEAALLAARRGKRRIGMAELEEAVDRIVVGPLRRGHRFLSREQQVIAYHEAGHALAAHLLPNTDPVHKISIVARGPSGGHTRIVPEDDRRLWTRSQLDDTLAYTLAGMAAEELVFGEPTTGPGNDLEQATRMARKMVVEYGMSERLGPISFGHDDENGLILLDGRREFSEQTAAQADAEVRRLVTNALHRATALLRQHRNRLSTLAERLLEHETLEGEELQEALGPGRKAA